MPAEGSGRGRGERGSVPKGGEQPVGSVAVNGGRLPERAPDVPLPQGAPAPAAPSRRPRIGPIERRTAAVSVVLVAAGAPPGAGGAPRHQGAAAAAPPAAPPSPPPP